MLARIGVMLGFREVMMWFSRISDRKRLYAWAKHRAEELHRPLIVIGDPQGGMTHVGEYGDMCVDLTGCPNAAPGTGVRADITKPRSIPKPDDSSVVFVSCVFEYVHDLEAAWNEVIRVAGSASNVFVCHVPKQSFAAWLYPGARYVIDSAPPTTPTLRARKVGSDYPVLTCAGDGSARPFCVWGKKPYGT